MTVDEVYQAVRKAASHLRPRQAALFEAEVKPRLEALADAAGAGEILAGVRQLSRLNWALIKPYLDVVAEMPHGTDVIGPWRRLAHDLARLDIDVGVAFLQNTPATLENRGAAGLLPWGELALDALSVSGAKTGLWKAVKVYLEQAATYQCGYSLSRWGFFLEQAARIAAVCPPAAEAFVQLGNRMCVLLTDAEAEKWVDEGLRTAKTEAEWVNYFGGASLKALETRDSLATGVALKDRSNTLALICEAALGRPLGIRSSTALIGQKEFTGGSATDGRVVFLPDTAPSFDLFKLMALHQVMLIDGQSGALVSGIRASDPVSRHLDADQRLLEKLPGLLKSMKTVADGRLPDAYPDGADKGGFAPPPWWGDILPDLVRQTQTTIHSLKQKAADEWEDIPESLIEALLSNLMAEGEREHDALWKLFRDIMDNMVMSSPDAEDLGQMAKTFFYKEWDKTLSDYKLDWCLVRHRAFSDAPNDFVEDLRNRLDGIIKLLRRQFVRLKPERFRKYRAQPAGDALDIDALVEAMVDRRSGSSFSENVYIRRDKRIRDVAALFLVDLSGSTEEEVNGRRVIDIQKDAMALMAEALDALGDPYAIYGFTSDGRFRVDMFSVKEFSEPYDQAARHRLGNLAPLGLTRMGAVVRHAAFKLNELSAAVKLMIILTDGRPYDLEYGNLDYAIADTGKAIQEARRQKIHPFIITSDQKGADYLKLISTETQSIVLPRVESLPTLLPALYKRLTL